AAKGNATAFANLTRETFAELGTAIAHIEARLADAVQYDKINYLMLMMVDPHVHFHVVPRYEGEREACGIAVGDSGWPKAPALGEAVTLQPDQVDSLAGWLRGGWPSGR
ncbi:MAG TPA: HIT family protein, partial [Allosphingosinicella sp.]